MIIVAHIVFALLGKIDEHWDYDKDRFEQNVSDFPDDAANWTGRKVIISSYSLPCSLNYANPSCSKVGEVEDIPDNIEDRWDREEDRMENKWDNAVDDVQDFPDNAAEWAGDKVGDVERFGDDVDQFGDDMGNAFDECMDEGRYDDDDGF